MTRCAACKEKIDNLEYLNCRRCAQKYHSLCLNIDRDEFVLLSEDYKSTWCCPSCQCKQKKGDNANISVRPSKLTGSPDYSFVNTRRKVQKPESSATARSSPVSFTDENTRNLRDIVREEMRHVFEECLNDFNTTLIPRFNDLSVQMSDFKESLNFMSGQFDKISSELTAVNAEVKSLRKENENLRFDLNSLSTRMSQLDQISRAANIEIQCVPEYKSENVVNIVKQIGVVTNLKINDNEIFYCSRIAKLNASSVRPRCILVKFNTPRTRDSFLAAVVKYNKEHSDDKLNTSHLGIALDRKQPIYVAENLTPENKSLHAAARIRAKELKYKFIWIRGGRIYVRKTESSDTVYIKNLEVIKSLS